MLQHPLHIMVRLARNIFLRQALCLLLSLLATIAAQAQTFDGKDDEPINEFDEIAATGIIEGLGTFQMDVIYTSNERLFINVEQLFKTLKLHIRIAASGDTLSGFLANEYETWILDFAQKTISGKRNIEHAKKYLLKEMGILYMDAVLFKDVFNLPVEFNYRALSCLIKPGFELPITKEKRLKKMHEALTHASGKTEKADTLVDRIRHRLRVGAADWGFSTTQQSGAKSINRFTAALGGELLFGEADFFINYTDQQKFDSRQLNFIWRMVNNNARFVKQAEAGRINSNLMSFINSPVIGASISNTPTTLRKANGFYEIDDFTSPGWTVELYLNNALADFTKADATGHFRFTVPIVYGHTSVKLKFYGLSGEERTEERDISTSFTLMPANEFEYNLSAGILQDGMHSRFARAAMNYGLGIKLTVGSGIEYLSSIQQRPVMPFAKITYQPISRLLLNGEYAPGVKLQAVANYNIRRNAFIDMSFTGYDKMQQAIPFVANQEWRTKISLPIRLKNIYGFTSIDYARLQYSGYNSSTAGANISIYYRNLSVIIANNLQLTEQKGKQISNGRSTLTTGLRLRHGLNIRPSVMINNITGQMIQAGCETEKRIRRGIVSLVYTKQFAAANYTLGATVRFDMQRFRTQASTQLSRDKITTTQSAQGGLSFGSGQKKIYASQNSAIRKGGLVILTYLDLNQNGSREKNEPLVKTSSVKLASSTAKLLEGDSLIRIPGLTAFTTYRISLQDRDLENIAWRFAYHVYDVMIDPNQFKTLEVPVQAMGEVNGNVYLNENNKLRGIGRILVVIRNEQQEIVAQTMSEPDGYVQYLGLKPGTYTACIDELQLQKLAFTVNSPATAFTIRQDAQGDIVTAIKFVLTAQKP